MDILANHSYSKIRSSFRQRRPTLQLIVNSKTWECGIRIKNSFPKRIVFIDSETGNIPQGQIHRLKRIWDTETDFDKRAKEMEQRICLKQLRTVRSAYHWAKRDLLPVEKLRKSGNQQKHDTSRDIFPNPYRLEQSFQYLRQSGPEIFLINIKEDLDEPTVVV